MSTATAPTATSPAPPLRGAPTPSGHAMFEPTPEDTQRRQRIETAWRAYRGEFKEPLDVKANQPNDNVLTNRCAGIVDTGVDWLSSKPFTLDVLPRGQKMRPGQKKPPQYQAYQDWLDGELFDDPDDMMTLFAENCQNGGVAGHTFTQIVWDSARMDVPRLVLLDPSNVYVTCDPDDANTAICYTVETLRQRPIVSRGGQPVVDTTRTVMMRHDPDGNARYRGGLDPDDTWTITTYQRAGGFEAGSAAGGWRQISETISWPFSFPPLAEAPNLVNPNEFWGAPDLTRTIIRLNEALIFNRSNTMRINKNYAMPWGLVAGAGGEQGRLPIQPGFLLKVPAGAQLLMAEAHGDIAGSKLLADDIMGDMDEISRISALAYGRHQNMPRGNVPGVTVELEFQSTIAKTAMKRRLYGRMWRNLLLWCLALKFGPGVLKTVRIELHWPSMLPNDDLATAQAAQLRQSQGIVSKHTLAGDQGYDYDREHELMAEEAKEEQEQAAALGMPDPTSPAPTADPGGAGGDPGQEPPGQGQQPPALNMPPEQATPGTPRARGRTR